jgi:hypothetical protein
MNYIFYTHHFDENSGGSSLFFKFCDYIRNNLGHDNFYIAPIFCRGDGMIDRNFVKNNNLNENDFVFDIHGNSMFFFDYLPDSYFNKENYNWPENYKKLLITREILNYKNNVAVYSEGILGNPLQQKFVMRWILYFTTPGLPVYPYSPWGKKDKFVFWNKAYFKNKDTFYRTIQDGCITTSDYYPKEEDILYLKYLFIHDILDLNYKNDKNISRNGSCYLIRKADPNYNRTFSTNWNDGEYYNKNHPFMKPKPPIYIHPTDSICIDSYGLKELIEIFKTSDFFYCYDLYTFHNCIALLYGCKVIMCIPEGKLSKEEWHCGDECYLDYVAWGDSKEELDKASESLKNINYGDIIKNIQNKFVHEFNEVYKNLELYYANVQNEVFDKTLTNIFCGGNNFKGIDCNTSTDYTKKLSNDFWEIEIDFIIGQDNVSYANIFDMNFNNTNFGPRLEYNDSCLCLLIGNSQLFKAIILDDNIVEGELYNLKLKFESKTLLIQFNNIFTKHHVYISPSYFDNIVLGKGFNDERYFKGFIQKFRVIIY